MSEKAQQNQEGAYDSRHLTADGLSAMMPPVFQLQADPSSTDNEATETSFPYDGYIVGTWSAALRSEPSKDPENPHQNTLADIPKGEQVSVIGKSGGWLEVEWKGLKGFVSQELVSNSKSESDQETNERSDEEIEAEFREQVGAGNVEDAVRNLLAAYGFTNENFDLDIVPSDQVSSGALATVGGPIEEGARQTMTVNRDILDNSDIGYIVRILGHEMQHVEQRSQENPMTLQTEREFLAYAWEVLDTNVPPHSDQNEIDFAIRQAIDFYERLPDEKQEEHEDIYNQLQSLQE